MIEDVISGNFKIGYKECIEELLRVDNQFDITEHETHVRQKSFITEYHTI